MAQFLVKTLTNYHMVASVMFEKYVNGNVSLNFFIRNVQFVDFKFSLMNGMVEIEILENVFGLNFMVFPGIDFPGSGLIIKWRFFGANFD